MTTPCVASKSAALLRIELFCCSAISSASTRESGRSRRELALTAFAAAFVSAADNDAPQQNRHASPISNLLMRAQRAPSHERARLESAALVVFTRGLFASRLPMCLP